jgi:hypothetical protein
MGKFVLGISRSEAASGVFMNACSEFQFLESVTANKEHSREKENDETMTLSEVNDLIVTILKDSESGERLASETKNTLLRLRPNFSEKSVGFSTFGKLIAELSARYSAFSVTSEQHNIKLSLNQGSTQGGRNAEQLTRENYTAVFTKILGEYKRAGFERINPPVLKSAVLESYPDFTERQIGYRRFSDILRDLEKAGLLKIEMSEGGNMLVRIV